jgi:hypothetical protein
MISGRTRDLIDEFGRCPHWFGFIGDPPGYDTVEQVDSLEAAIKMYHSTEWDDTCLEARNGLTMRLDRDFPGRLEDWNKFVREIDSLLIPFIDPLAFAFIEAHPEVPRLRDTFKHIRLTDQPKPKPHECLKFRQTLLSTTRMACMEAEYSDVIPLAFFSEMSAWYLAGYLPCGLSDEYPIGKLIVF